MSCQIALPIKPISLEDEYADFCFADVDIEQPCKFNYLYVNEYPMAAKKINRRLAPHLAKANDGGILVSVGLQRCLFNLLLAPPGKFVGLVNRDIAPRIKAYTDFNTMLLRISKNLEQYVTLSEPTFPYGEKAFNERITLLNDQIEKTCLPERVRTYYQKHLKDFGSVYLNKSHPRMHEWRSLAEFKDVKYFQDEKLFSILQQYARDGNMISVLGPINDLKFLQNRQISLVDTSNVCDYSLIDLKGGPGFNPRVIVAHQFGVKTTYRSYIHRELSFDENEEFDHLLEVIQMCTDVCDNDDGLQWWMEKYLRPHRIVDPFNADFGVIRSFGTLQHLRKYVETYIVYIPHVLSYNLYEDKIDVLNTAPQEHIELICKHEKVRSFIKIIAQASQQLSSSVYLAFSHVEGWKEEFDEHMKQDSLTLGIFLKKLKIENRLENFIDDYGKENLDYLKQCVLKVAQLSWSQVSTSEKTEFYKSLYLTVALPAGHSIQKVNCSWARQHAFDDYDQFYSAFDRKNAISLIKTRLDALSVQQRNAVFGHVYTLAGSPATDDLQWGEHHAFEDLSRLNKAIKL